ncbi:MULTISPECIES: Ig-like domain-containing protein [unclassified Pseudoclavibacter]|uniref:Ig-like domain-containing protein n=1 Tax=unclassified Pseudoclavibacter TaxID=2615177 RepID=UPI001BAA0568|nr:Ig-like domain-containing protein [Pseudoclavibacter sp. Marseille-Q4354]MBS3179793.1 cadherin-like domain-containing protein [Pseudoclavibacter sp. Marseille-Q4354]
MRRTAPRPRGRRQLAMTLVLALLVGTPLLFALLHEGFAAAEIEVESSDVWVSNSQDLRAGRLNAQIQELDASVSLVTADVGILQDGDTVFLHDQTSGSLGRVDPALTDLRESILTPAGSRSSYGGGVIALLDPATGRLWLIDAAQPLAFDAATAEPVAELGAHAQVVVTPLGTVLAVSPEKQQILRMEGLGAEQSWEPLAGSPGEYELTAVGEQPVVFDREAGSLLVDGEARPVPETALRVQLPGAAAPEIVFATVDGALRVPLDGGDPVSVPAGIDGSLATPEGTARPAVVGGCTHAAWAQTATTMVACGGGEPRIQSMSTPPLGEILFRVNRNVVALNDVATGQVWLPQENMRLVENWNELVPPEDADGVEGENEATEESFEATLAERGEVNTPPDLVDDVFGVRAGSTGYLTVLDNDSDVDGDILTITGLAGDVPESFGELRLIDDGRALQFRAADGASGEQTLTYTATDGRQGGVAEARLTIRIQPADAENQAPTTNRTSTVAVEAGQKISYNVIPDWIDPDGDPIFLQGATAPVGDAVGFTPDGRITFTAASAELGERVVPYLVSDGSSQAAGELRIRVEAPGTLGPIGTPDYARGVLGETVTAQPLVNDLSPNGQALGLVEIAELGTATGGASFNPDLGTVTFTSETAMTAYVQYTVTAGAATSVGIIRFDVEDPAAEPTQVTAVRDLAYLRPGQSNAVDVLGNDVSTGTGVLSVQSVETTDEARIAGLAVELIDNTIVRLSSQAAIQQAIELPYTITDGAATSVGYIVVVPVEPAVTHEPPVAVDDTRRVRAGDYTSVSVLENDSHPDEAQMSLAPELNNVQVGDGYTFVSGDDVRLQAPSEPGTYSLGYTVVDEHGEQAGANLTFQVTAPDESSNRPPEPGIDTARVFEGASVRIEVPLNGIDPDGDSVELTQLVDVPKLGSVREVTQTSFIYEAFAGASGTDVLRYEVVDGYGQRAEGTIKVGVVARPTATAPPVAVDDTVRAKPGSRIAVPALQNDSDPNGYPLELVPELVGVDASLDAEVDGDSVIVTVPSDGEFVSVPYTITNGQGGQDAAFIHITISADAPTLPPTATDHVVRLDDFGGAETLSVNVRDGELAHPPAWVRRAVDLVGAGAGAAQVEEDGRVTVTISDVRQIIVYRLTAADTGLTAAGFLMVPALITEESKRQSPFLIPDLPAQKVKVGESISWNVNDLVRAPSGNRVVIINPEEAWAEQADGSPIVQSDTELRFTPKPGFRGPASITFQVSDADGDNDPNAGIATIRVPIAVGDPDFFDVAPTFVAPQLTIEQGTEQSFDLSTATGHPNKDVVPQVQFSKLTGGAGDLTASLDGSTVKVGAGVTTKVGTVAKYTVTYTFREFVQTGTVTVTVVSTSKPLPRAVPDEQLARRNEPVTMNVTANDFNPFPESPLKLLAASDVSGGAEKAAVSIVDGQLRIVPATNFIGTITVSYRIGDQTGDPLRETTGLATVEVQDVPGIPTSVTLEKGSALGTLVVGWSSAISNGSEITGYEVTLTGGNSPIVRNVDGSVFSVTFTGEDGLKVGVQYSATVRATNALGIGNPSEPSGTDKPINLPTAPQSVSVPDRLTAPGETTGTLTAEWSAPSSDGGGLTGYDVSVQIGTATPAVTSVPPTQLSLDITGITVPKYGSTPVRVVVTAKNTAGTATSANPAIGNLRYTPLYKVAVTGGKAVPGQPDEVKSFIIKGEDFSDVDSYTVKCYSNGKQGADKSVGEQSNVSGTALKAEGGVVVPDCKGSLGGYWVEIFQDGVFVVKSDVLEKW